MRRLVNLRSSRGFAAKATARLRQSVQDGMGLQPGPHRGRRCSSLTCLGGDVCNDPSLRRDLRCRADREMTGQSGLATDADEIAKLGRARNAHLGNDQTMPSNSDIMGDLDEVIDFRALANDRVARRATIDRRIGADLHVILDNDATDLRHFQMAAPPRSEAETVLPDRGAGMNDHAIADQSVGDRGAGADRAVPANPHLRTDDGIGPNDGARTYFGPRPDDRSRIDAHVGF